MDCQVGYIIKSCDLRIQGYVDAGFERGYQSPPQHTQTHTFA